MKDISVVILNWNGTQMMRRFLPSVVKYSPEADIVVADNGSTDESLEVLAKEFPMVRIMALGKNYGFAEGYNRALAQITTRYSLLLNDDVEVTEGWLRPLLLFMDVHTEVAACQPKVLSEIRRDFFEYAGACGGFMDIWGYPYCRGRMMEVVERDEGQYNNPCSVFWGTGAALMVRTKVFREEGGLDSRFFAHMEEIDFCWRLRSRGYQIYCIPESKVYHVGGGTLPKSNPRKTFLNFRNNLWMLYKNLPEKWLWKVMAARFVLDYLAALKMLFEGNFGEASAVVKARWEFQKTKHTFDTQRFDNLKKTSVSDVPELRKESLLVAFYLKRLRKFAQWS